MKARIYKSLKGDWFVVQDEGAKINYFCTWQESIDWVVNPQKYYWGIERLQRRRG